MRSDLFADPQRLAALCRRHRIARLSLFGSRLNGVERADSDVDLLVEFESGAKPGLLGLAALEAEFSAAMGGRKADLRTPEDLSRWFRDKVMRDAEVQYAA